MSLILDALRKSEAERRRGEMPDLRAELPPTVRSVAPRRRWPLWFAGIAMAVAAVAVGWGLWERTPKVPPTDTVVEAENTEVPDEVPVTATTDFPSEPAVAAPVRPTPVPDGEPHAARPVADDVRAAAPAREATPTAAPVASTQVPPAPVASAPANVDTRYEEAIANAASASTAAAPVPAPASAPAPVAPLPMPPPATGAAVRIADLSPGEREQLPALKISMHMFGPTPTQRFAIIDGARVTQGDRVGEAVVEEIASDGVVLNWHGRRLSLPLR